MPHPVHPGLILEMNVTKGKDVTKNVRECLQIIEVRLVSEFAGWCLWVDILVSKCYPQAVIIMY